MSVTAEELIIAVRDDGIGETRDKLQGVEESMEETAGAAADSAEEMEGFSQRFKGALSAAIAGMAVAIGGLTSSIPVLGELMGGLFAIFAAFAFQIDRLTRALGAGGLTDVLYGISQFIFSLEGGVANLAAVFGIWATVVAGAVAGLTAWAIKAQGAIAVAKTLGGVLLTVGSAITGLVVGAIAGTGALVAALAAAFAALIGFTTAYIFNLGGVRDKTNAILGQIAGFFVGLGEDLSSWATGVASDAFSWGTNLIGRFLDGLGSLSDRVVQGFSTLASGLTEWAGNLADSAYNWGKALIQQFINGIREMLNQAGDFLGEIEQTIGINIPDAGSAPTTGAAVGGAVGGGAGSTIGGLAGSLFSRENTRSSAQIDGRALSESTGRYRSDPARRRGL